MSDILHENDLRPHTERAQALIDGLDAAILGQPTVTRTIVTALLAGGHILLEGLPGLGKTELVKALAALTGCATQRLQCTPDLLPSDITGAQILVENEHGRQLEFRPGPVFTQLLLADEINRASPKTQAALLQAMAERQVTVHGHTHDLPQPFFVLATQNPIDLEGTYPLPEAQLDRFLCKLHVTGIDPDTLAQLLAERPSGSPPAPSAVLGPDDLLAAMACCRRVVLPPAVADYAARVIHATRPETPEALPMVRSTVRWGASPRAALALCAAARAAALLDGRPAVGFKDLQALAVPVLAHRLMLSHDALLDEQTPTDVMAQLLQEIPEVRAA